MSHNQPLLSSTIEADDTDSPFPSGNIGSPNATAAPARPPPLSTSNSGLPTPVTQGNAQAGQDEGVVAMFKRSSHPMILLSLYLFRSLAIAVYVLMGLFTSNYVLSTVIVVVLLSMDFWNTRNVCGRTLVGLRYWNQVDEDGESAWVFESRDPSIPANPVDSKLFWTALYAYPVGWAVLFFVSLLKFSVSYLPIVGLALVFNLSNVLGFTYADRDAKQRWASTMGSSFSLGGLGGLGGQLVGGAVRSGLGRVLGGR